MAAKEVFPLAGRRVLVAGPDAMAAAALMRRLARESCAVVTDRDGAHTLSGRRRAESWLKDEGVNAAFVLARSGSAAAVDLVEAARGAGIAKLLFLGTGGIEPCRIWRAEGGNCIVGTAAELYGPGDSYDAGAAGPVAEAIAKVRAAKKSGADTVTLSYDGAAQRDFLYTEDLADGLVFMMKCTAEDAPLCLGSGSETAIVDAAAAVARCAGWRGRFVYGLSRPDDARPAPNVRRLAALGWLAKTRFEDGLKVAYEWYDARVERISAPA